MAITGIVIKGLKSFPPKIEAYVSFSLSIIWSVRFSTPPAPRAAFIKANSLMGDTFMFKVWPTSSSVKTIPARKDALFTISPLNSSSYVQFVAEIMKAPISSSTANSYRPLTLEPSTSLATISPFNRSRSTSH